MSLDSLALVAVHFHSPHSGEEIGWVSQVGCQRTLPQVLNPREGLRVRLLQHPQFAI